MSEYERYSKNDQAFLAATGMNGSKFKATTDWIQIIGKGMYRKFSQISDTFY